MELALSAIIWILLLVWTHKVATDYKRNAIGWTIAAVILPPILVLLVLYISGEKKVEAN